MTTTHLSTAPRHAKSIGRVGALAAALGVGMAILTGPGVGTAHATETEAAGDPSDTESPSGTAPAQEHDGASSPQPNLDAGPKDSPPSSIAGSSPRMKLHTSGGSLTSDRWQRRSGLTQHRRVTTDGPNEVVASVNTQSSRRWQRPRESRPAFSAITVSRAPTPQKSTAAQLATPAKPKREFHPPEGIEAPNVTPLNAEHGQPIALNRARGADATTPTAALRATTLISNATGVLSAALAPLSGPGQAPQAQPPVLLAVLGWLRREIERTFLNRRPEIRAQTVQVFSGEPKTFEFDVVSDDDTLTYTVPDRGQPGGPQYGTVTIDQTTGKYTYTSDSGAQPGQVDEFTVTVSDEASRFHLHGLLGFLRPGGGHVDSAKITVTVADDAPNAPNITYNVNIGEPISINLADIATDPNGDALRFPVVNVYPVDEPNRNIRLELENGEIIGSVVFIAHDMALYMPDGVHTDFGSFQFTASEPGTYVIEYTVTDEKSRRTGTITVNAAQVVAVRADHDDLIGSSPL